MALTSSGGKRKSDALTCRLPQPERSLPCTAGGSLSEPCSVLSSSRKFTCDPADQILVAAGSAWKYNDSGANLGTAWRAAAYNDAAWTTGVGAARLRRRRRGDRALLRHATRTNRRITYYFRRSFTVANPAAFAALTVRFVRDDGCSHLSQRRRGRPLQHAGGDGDATRRCATTAIGGADESAWHRGADRSLAAGRRHQRHRRRSAPAVGRRAPTSASISSCVATEAQAAAPTVTPDRRRPTTASSNSTDVTFTATVTAPAGLASATLYIGGPPQTVVVQRARAGGGRADHGRHADDARRQQPVDQRRRSDPARARPDEVSDTYRRGTGQVPAGAIITSATLQLNCTNAGKAMRLYRLTQSWIEERSDMEPARDWRGVGLLRAPTARPRTRGVAVTATARSPASG